MTWSLKVQNGDLALGSGQLDTVIRDSKLAQDFRHFLLTHLGSDPAYPWYGSTIDGGNSNGLEIASPVATTDWRFAQVQLESEIRRVAARYQRLQLERAKSDRLRYNKSTLTAGEILAAVTNIEFLQQEDKLQVKIHFSTATDVDTTVDITIPPVLSR